MTGRRTAMEEKRRRVSDDVAGAADVVAVDDGWRWCEGMNPDVLALIFCRIPADMLLRTVPFVCRSWRDAVAGPYFWEEIDVEEWCRRVNRTDVVDFAVRKLVGRSRGTLRRLSAYRLGDSGFAYAASCGKLLEALKIPMSEVTDAVAIKYAACLSLLTTLDISYCLKITSRSIEVLVTNCKSLIHLRRNMPPFELELKQGSNEPTNVDEGEAMAIANSMPKLELLELAYGRFTDEGLDAIVTHCKDLRVLDIRGCWNINKLYCPVWEKCDSIEEFRLPWEDDCSVATSTDEDDDETDDDEGDDASSSFNFDTTDEESDAD